MNAAISTMNGNCRTGEARLANSSTSEAAGLGIREGRLEVCVNNAWGAVCSDDRFGVAEAYVACNQVGGYQRESGEEIAVLEGSGVVFLFELNCDGDEESLLQCQSFHTDNFECASGQDVAIRCTGNFFPFVHTYV